MASAYTFPAALAKLRLCGLHLHEPVGYYMKPTFTYRGDPQHGLINLELDRESIHLDLIDSESSAHAILPALLRQLAGRFRRAHFFILSTLHTHALRAAAWTMSDTFHVIFIGTEACLTRKLPIPLGAGILHDCTLKPLSASPHAHIQVVTFSDQLVHVALEPPMLFKPNNETRCELPMEMSTEAGQTRPFDLLAIKRQVNKLLMRPWKGKTVFIEHADHIVVEKLMMPLTGSNADMTCPALQTWVYINHKARVIQRAWREAISNPVYCACRRRLMREAAELAQMTM